MTSAPAGADFENFFFQLAHMWFEKKWCRLWQPSIQLGSVENCFLRTLSLEYYSSAVICNLQKHKCCTTLNYQTEKRWRKKDSETIIKREMSEGFGFLIQWTDRRLMSIFPFWVRKLGIAHFSGQIKTLMQQLLSGVKHLHDEWILHRDLKTSNLLLSHQGILKVSHFFRNVFKFRHVSGNK